MVEGLPSINEGPGVSPSQCTNINNQPTKQTQFLAQTYGMGIWRW